MTSKQLSSRTNVLRGKKSYTGIEIHNICKGDLLEEFNFLGHREGMTRKAVRTEAYDFVLMQKATESVKVLLSIYSTE